MASKKEIPIIKTDHSTKFKMDVMAAFAENKFDAEKTGKQMGISPVLVREWFKESGLSVPDTLKNNLPAVSSDVQAQIAKLDEDNALIARKVQASILERLEELVQTAKDPEFVVKALDAVTRAVKETKEESGGGVKGGTKKAGTYTAINQQYNNIVMNPNFPKKNGNNKA